MCIYISMILLALPTIYLSLWARSLLAAHHAYLHRCDPSLFIYHPGLAGHAYLHHCDTSLFPNDVSVTLDLQHMRLCIAVMFPSLLTMRLSFSARRSCVSVLL
jgi:hypothetical protein